MKESSKTTLKICLLFVGVSLAIVAVLTYMKSRMTPPNKLDYKNQYVFNIQQMSDELSHSNNQQLEESYQLIDSRIQLFASEGFIDSDNQEACITAFSNEYSKAFKTWADSKFHASVWNSGDLSFMRSRIKKLREKGHLDDTSKVKLSQVEKVLNDYNSAIGICNATVTSSAQSKQLLSKASAYRNNSYLSHCVSLQNKLIDLPTHLQKSHHTYVANTVKKLMPTKYNLTQIAQWGENYRKARELVEDYNDNAYSLYGVGTDNFDLNDYWHASKYYFKEQLDKLSRWDDAYSSANRDYYNVF